MKKRILQTIFLFLLSYNINAQITITQADMPVIGDIQATVDAEVNPGISIGSPGANQTWDFSGLVGVDTTISNFITPAGTPGESSFPTATIALEFDGDYSYVNVNSTAAIFLGVSIDTSGMGDYTSLVFDPTQKFFELPTTYLTSYMDESGFSITLEGSEFGFDSVRIINTAMKDVNFDGWGTVITPDASFDGLREEVITTSSDIFQVLVLGFWQTVSDEVSVDTSYNWYSKNSKGFLVSIDILDDEITDVSYQILDPVIVAPVASFTYTDQGQGEVDFEDQSSNQPTSWEWTFGDGNTSDMQNPSHTYAGAATYTVCLTVSNSAGSDTNCQMLIIGITIPPTAAFSFTDQGQGDVDFMDESTNQPTSWEWDFDDGNTSNMQNPSYTFDTTGMYNVCLTVSNIAGSNTSCQTVDIIVTSINVLVNDLKVELFPNPVTDWLNLKLEGTENQKLDFVLYNNLGQPVLNRKIISNGQYNFDVKNLSSGIYHFLLKTENGQFVSNGSFMKSNNP